MKKIISTLLASCCLTSLIAQEVVVKGPDEKLQLVVSASPAEKPSYSITYNGKTMLEKSPLGMNTNIGDFVKGMKLIGHAVTPIDTVYHQDRIKTSKVHYQANELICNFENSKGQKIDVVFRVSNHDVAFRYTLPRQDGKGSVTVTAEETGFRFPQQTTTFLCPQSDAMIGWKRTKPSYEEEYKADAPMSDRSQYGHGYTFPCLFRIGDDGWVLVSETGVDSRYCGSRLSDVSEGNLYTVAFPMAAENNGNGTSAPAFALPGATPWRTITVGETLKPIVETTVIWDVVRPLYETTHDYRFGRGTWSWILWQDGSINYDDQVRYIDFAAAMGYEYALIDNWWDTNIGRDRMKSLIEYARSKGVELFLWYSSSGYWNDIEQGPVNHMDNAIIRKREMKWLQSLGVKGIKVDFFGGDKQETMRLYEEILSDADDHGLMVIFHGCTLPRGWSRTYPNLMSMEAVYGAEQYNNSPYMTMAASRLNCTYPFTRNVVGSMDYTPVAFTDSQHPHRTTYAHELALSVIFESGIQHWADRPEGFYQLSDEIKSFMSTVPAAWDDTRFIEGYPGEYVVMARRKGTTWVRKYWLSAPARASTPLPTRCSRHRASTKSPWLPATRACSRTVSTPRS